MAVDLDDDGSTAIPSVNGTSKISAGKAKLKVGNAITPSSTDGQTTTSTSTAHAIGEFQYAPLSTPYRVLQQYHSKPTKVRVACIGAGAGGLCVSYKIVCSSLTCVTLV